MNEAFKKTGPRIGNVPRYMHRQLSPREFAALQREANVSIRDFMFITGRHSNTVAQFHGHGDTSKSRNQTPTMGDVMILELIRRHPEIYDLAMAIANEYSEGPRFKREIRKGEPR